MTVAAAPQVNLCFVLLNQTGRSDVDAFLPRLRDALDESLNQHLAPFHGGRYGVRQGANPSDRNPGEVGVHIYETKPDDPPGALGWHQVTAGVPDVELPLHTMNGLTGDGQCLDAVADHELKETAVDPGANRWVDNGNGKMSALEACDRVEDGTYKASNGLTLSNFLLPAAWVQGAAGPYDYLGALTAQLDSAGNVTKTPGGYDIEGSAPTDIADVSKGGGASLGQMLRKFITEVKVVFEKAFEGGRLARKQSPYSRTYRRGGRL